MLFENRISISYEGVLQISAQLEEAVITQYFEDGVVCPPNLRKGLFTTSALDNINHNPYASTATTSFHGSMSAHHATQKRDQPFKVSIISLLPLLRDEAHSIATVKHGLEKIKETVQFLNPGQTPVVAADQPLYSLAKQIQWQWPEYREDKVVMMFGGLHKEMAALKSVGSLLQDSGLTSALVEAGVASSGTSESHLPASNVTKTRQAHQITACCLYKQRKAAYNSFSRDASQSPQDVLDSEEWCKKRRLTVCILGSS